MKRILLSIVVLGMFAAGFTGCRAGVDVDPHGSSSVSAAR
jgi:hypothetical protein